MMKMKLKLKKEKVSDRRVFCILTQVHQNMVSRKIHKRKTNDVPVKPREIRKKRQKSSILVVSNASTEGNEEKAVHVKRVKPPTGS